MFEVKHFVDLSEIDTEQSQFLSGHIHRLGAHVENVLGQEHQIHTLVANVESPIFGIEVPGSNAEDIWKKLHDARAVVNFSPVVLKWELKQMNQRELAIIEVAASEDLLPLESRLRAPKIDVPRWLKNKGKEVWKDNEAQLKDEDKWPTEDQSYPPELQLPVPFPHEIIVPKYKWLVQFGDVVGTPYPNRDDPTIQAELAEWEEYKNLVNGLNSTQEFSDRALELHQKYVEQYVHFFEESVVIALVPTPNSLEIPAYLGFGGYNNCPKPDYHTAVLKYLDELHGVSVFGIGSEHLFLKLDRPARNFAEAMERFRDIFNYTEGDWELSLDPKEAIANFLHGNRLRLYWD